MPGKPSYFNQGDRPPLTEKQMFAKLAERTGKLQVGRSEGAQPEATAQPDGAKPSSTPPTLEWLVPSGGAVLTQCGHYSVSGARVNGEWRFTAWTRKPTPNPIGEATKTADEAKQLCARHWEAIQ